MSPVFLSTPLEVSMTLECARMREWICHGLLGWVGGEFAACVMSMSAERLHGAKLRLSFSPLSQFFFSLYVLSLVFQPGMVWTCLLNLHKLASEICAYPPCIAQSEWAGCSKGIADDSIALIDKCQSISGSPTNTLKHGQVRTQRPRAGVAVRQSTTWSIRRVIFQQGRVLNPREPVNLTEV